MELTHTLIIAPEHPCPSDIFVPFIENSIHIPFIVLGYDEISRSIVERADYYAREYDQVIPRQVIWIQDENSLQKDCLQYLRNKELEDLDGIRAFVLTPRLHRLSHVFYRTDIVGNYDISKAYWRAITMES